MPGSIDIYIEAVCLNSPGIAGWGAFISDGALIYMSNKTP